MSFLRDALSINRYWGKKVGIQMAMTLFNKESAFPPFYPVIVQTDQLDFVRKNAGSNIEAINLFPYKNGNWFRQKQSLHGVNIIEFEQSHVLEDRLIITTDRFDYGKVNKIAGFVKENGAITFVLEDLEQAREFISNLDVFKKLYDVHAYLGHKSGNSSPESSGDSLVAVVSIYDLRYTVPIYNRKKADGLGVQITLAWRKGIENSGTMRFADEIAFIVSAHPDNVHRVDGQKIFSKNWIGNEYIGHFREVLAREIKRSKEAKKSTKSTNKTGSEMKEKKLSTMTAPTSGGGMSDLSTDTFYTYYETTSTSTMA